MQAFKTLSDGKSWRVAVIYDKYAAISCIVQGPSV